MVSGLWYEENILGHTTDKTYVTQYTIDYLYDNFYNTNDIVKNFCPRFVKNLLNIVICHLLFGTDSLKEILIIFIQNYKFYHDHLSLISDSIFKSKKLSFLKENEKFSYTKRTIVILLLIKKANSLTIRDANEMSVLSIIY